MRKLHQLVTACALGAITLTGSALAAEAVKEPTGKELAFNNRKGNCLACHAMPTVPDAESAGLYGPPLIAMSARFPDKARTARPDLGRVHIQSRHLDDPVRQARRIDGSGNR